MRLVLDTNVLVSGLLNPRGAPGRLLDLLLAGQIVPLFDDRIVAKYREVLARPRFGFEDRDARAVLDYLTLAGEPVAAPPLDVTLPDPDDLPFLEVAAAGRADALVTGNPRHFVPKRGKTAVAVLSPSEVLRIL